MKTQRDHAEDGLQLLRLALECFKASDNRQTAERVRAAISSAKGAIRICGYRETRERTREQDIDRERILLIRGTP